LIGTRVEQGGPSLGDNGARPPGRARPRGPPDCPSAPPPRLEPGGRGPWGDQAAARPPPHARPETFVSGARRALTSCDDGRRASAFSSWARSLIAARSSSVNPLDFFLIAVVLLADFCVSFFGLIETSSY